MQTIDNVWHPKQCTAGKASPPPATLSPPPATLSPPYLPLPPSCLPPPVLERKRARLFSFFQIFIPSPSSHPSSPHFHFRLILSTPHSSQPQSKGRLDSYTLKCNIKNCRDRKLLWWQRIIALPRGSSCLSSAVYLFLELYFSL